MVNEKFVEAVKRQIKDVWKAPTAHQTEWILEALQKLYESISDRASIADSLDQIPEYALEQHASYLYQVQQTICFTPLRFFLKELAEDESLVIRAAAKGELSDREGFQWANTEAGLMGQANLITMQEGATQSLSESLNADPLIVRAYQLWEVSKIPIAFVPGLTITIVGPELNKFED